MPVDLSPDNIITLIYYLPFSVLFYVLLFLIGRYLFRRIPDGPWRPPLETGRLAFGLPIAVSIYLLLTILYFAPYLSRLGDALIGPPEDNMRFFWNLWYSREVLHGQYEALLRCDVIGFPGGVSMLYHSYSYYNLLLSALLTSIIDLVLTYNLLIMHTFVIGGVGAFLLGRYLLRDDYLALVVGFIFAFSPFHFARVLHHLNIGSLHFVPFFILFYIRAIREQDLKYTVLAGLMLALNALCSWNFLILGAYFMMLAYAYLALRRGRFFLWGVLSRTAVVVAIVLVLLSFLLIPMIFTEFSHSQMYKGGHGTFVADFAGFFIPNAQHWLGRIPPADTLNDTFHGNDWESAVYLGIFLILIIIATIRYTITESSRYILGLIACLVLAMGRWLYIFGWKAPLILPYNVLAYVPFFSNLRAPSRHMVYASLFLALLVGIGLRHLCRSRARSSRVRICFAALSLIILIDYYSYDKEMTPVILPPAYEAILRHGDGAILDLPKTLLEDQCQSLLYQTIHGQPIVNCPISRKLEMTLADRLSDTLDIQLRQLAENEVRYLVVHKEFLNEEQFVDTLFYDQKCRRLHTDDSQIVYIVY